MHSRHIFRYFNPINYANYFRTRLNRNILPWVEYFIAPSYKEPLKYRPFFIIGAPRSGSTLLTQVLTDAFDFGYLSNAHCRYYGSPALAEKIFHPLQNRKPSNFESTHGVAVEVYGPSECGDWWYRFFRRQPAYVPLCEIDTSKLKRMRCSIAAFSNIMDRPIIFKNLYSTLRLQAIIKYFPEALFIIIERGELDNAQSLLAGRKKVYGSYNEWWSVEPPEINRIKQLPAHIQVVKQVRRIYELIEQDIMDSGIDHGRIYRVRYENLCANVHGMLMEFEEFIKKNNVILERRFEVPKYFDVRSNILIEPELYKQLKEYLDVKS